MSRKKINQEIQQDIKQGEGFEDRLLRLKDVLQLIPVGRSSFYKGIKDGKYPAPAKLGPRTSAWRLSDILELMD